jgi:F-type H+-transporting ATPase subunit b
LNPVWAVAADAARAVGSAFGQEEPGGLTINLFWIIVVAVNFIVFLGVIYVIFFRPVSALLEERRARIEQGLRDADQARIEREQAADERLKVLTEARSEAEDILARAQRLAEESRERDMTELRAQLEQMRERAAADITAEKDRALADVRNQVADLALAAAGRVVGETMTSERERRLVEEFLSEVGTNGSNKGSSRTRAARN